jgi:hypothetical protein
MKKYILIFGLIFLGNQAFSQELNCSVQINAQQTGQPNLSIFKTLENALTEFINETNWTNQNFEDHEKINCDIVINLTSYDAGAFSGSLQIQSSRPVYGSAMTTPIFTSKDSQFSFQYVEFENLDYNPNSFDSNLVSVIAYYVYTVLGMDADTFSPMGGSDYFQEANQIVGTAQQSSYPGWQPGDDKSRYRFSADIISTDFEPFRQAMYTYHRQGLDVMSEDVKAGKQKVAEAIALMAQLNNINMNSSVVRAFFDAKHIELEKIFSGGPSVDITGVVDDLNDLAPQYSKNWGNINY